MCISMKTNREKSLTGTRKMEELLYICNRGAFYEAIIQQSCISYCKELANIAHILDLYKGTLHPAPLCLVNCVIAADFLDIFVVWYWFLSWFNEFKCNLKRLPGQKCCSSTLCSCRRLQKMLKKWDICSDSCWSSFRTFTSCIYISLSLLLYCKMAAMRLDLCHDWLNLTCCDSVPLLSYFTVASINCVAQNMLPQTNCSVTHLCNQLRSHGTISVISVQTAW